MNAEANAERCVIEIGEIPLALCCADREFLEVVRQRHAGFLSSSAPEVELDIEVRTDGPVSDDDVRVRWDGDTWCFERGDFRAQWDPAERRAQVCQRANPYALDSVLRILHSMMLAERGGFLLHAASAIYGTGATGARGGLNETGSRAYLFSGVSGAGKTTITRLAPAGATLLTDEISYVRPSHGGGYQAFGTPFAGELAKPGENCSAPIAALFFLEKGPENRIEEMPSGEAARRLMRNILFFADDRKLVENLFATACEFVEKVPVRRLSFYPDGRVWDDIRNFDRIPAHV